MKKVWFKEWGLVYRPISWQGFTLIILSLIFCVQVFTIVDSNSHSISDTLYGIFPFFIPTFLLLEWIASKTSNPKQTH
jgi:hypothetical protein